MSPMDITGMKRNKLTALFPVSHDKHGNVIWEFACDCGNHTQVTVHDFLSDNTKSCGCIRCLYGDTPVRQERLYSIYYNMKDRCYNPNARSYKNYGGRGIKMCDEWRYHYDLFREWALQHGYNSELTIDRIDNDGDYCPENCRWVTLQEQNCNTSRNVYITFNGVCKMLKDWASDIGITPTSLQKRLRKWPIERALTEPRNEDCVHV